MGWVKGYPKDWRERSREAYEEGGRGIGAYLAEFPDREPEVWALVAGTRVWKRWYLRAFVAHWKAENPAAYQAAKDRRYLARRRARVGADRINSGRQASSEELLSQSPSRPQVGRPTLRGRSEPNEAGKEAGANAEADGQQ